jgi:transposase
VIGVGPGLQVLVATKPVDFRRGAESLASLARSMGHDIAAPGTVVVFRAKRADRIKIITWDGSGLVMMWKALGEGAFKWPPVSDGVMRLSPAQLAALLEGLEWGRVQPRRRAAPGAFR